MLDAIAAGRVIRVLSVVDAHTRECLALEVETSFFSRRVTRVLDAIIAQRGEPRSIRCDNGPELTSRHFIAWCIERMCFAILGDPSLLGLQRHEHANFQSHENLLSQVNPGC